MALLEAGPQVGTAPWRAVSGTAGQRSGSDRDPGKNLPQGSRASRQPGVCFLGWGGQPLPQRLPGEHQGPLTCQGTSKDSLDLFFLFLT